MLFHRRVSGIAVPRSHFFFTVPLGYRRGHSRYYRGNTTNTAVSLTLPTRPTDIGNHLLIVPLRLLYSIKCVSISDKGRIEVTGASVSTLSTGATLY